MPLARVNTSTLLSDGRAKRSESSNKSLCLLFLLNYEKHQLVILICVIVAVRVPCDFETRVT